MYWHLAPRQFKVDFKYVEYTLYYLEGMIEDTELDLKEGNVSEKWEFLLTGKKVAYKDIYDLLLAE